MNTQNIASNNEPQPTASIFFYRGKTDGEKGIDPNSEFWTNLNYRSGWVFGITEYHSKKVASIALLK